MEGIGGSEAAAVLGISPWVSPLALYLRKLKMMPEQEGSQRMQWGLDLEDAIANYYERETGRLTRKPPSFTIYQSKEHPYMMATIDRLIEPIDKRGLGVLQIKTGGPGMIRDWEEEIPLYYQVQIQHEMAVTGATWGSFAVFFGDYKDLIIDVERNERFVEILIEKEGEFWERIKNQDPPPVDHSESSKEALHHQYPKDTGEAIPLPGDAIMWDEDLQEIKAREKQLKKEKTELENKIKSELKTAQQGVLTNGVVYTWTSHEREAFWVEATTVRTLRRKR
jgi:putative phage-type endonuclease